MANGPNDPVRPGIRFRLFPTYPGVFASQLPETVTIAGRPGDVGPGPSDARAYLVNPPRKTEPYGLNEGPVGLPELSLPPWSGPVLRPIQPSAEGHFDHIPVEAPEFAEAHVFGSVRFVMDIWERYLGRRIPWHFARDFDRLEIVMLPTFNNAHVGYGFMEVGADQPTSLDTRPFALNFDVLAHELGHLIIYGLLGVPDPLRIESEYFGFQEAAADITALVASLHFVTLVDRLLVESEGNLYSYNELNRFAELSASEQIRLASNSVKMSEFAFGWDDEHALSQPMMGAFFDILVDMFQERLVDHDLIGRTFAEMSREVESHPANAAILQAHYSEAFRGRAAAFRRVLMETRDAFGAMIALTWGFLAADGMRYAGVVRAMLRADALLTGGRFRRAILESAEWREIGRFTAGPRRSKPDRHSHAFSARTLVPGSLAEDGLPRCCSRSTAFSIRPLKIRTREATPWPRPF